MFYFRLLVCLSAMLVCLSKAVINEIRSRSKTIWRNQFGGKINKNDLPSLALMRQQKSFVITQRQLKKQL